MRNQGWYSRISAIPVSAWRQNARLVVAKRLGMLLSAALMIAVSSCSDNDLPAPLQGELPGEMPVQLKDAVAALEYLQSGRTADFHGHFSSLRDAFMPNPGRFFKGYKQFLVGPSVQAVYFEVEVTNSAVSADVEFDVGAYSGRLHVDPNTGQAELSVGPSAVKAKAASQDLLGVRFYFNENIRACLNDVCTDIDRTESENAVLSRVERNSWLGNVQYVDDSKRLHWFDSNLVVKRESPHPRGVLSWEGMSKAYYKAALSIQIGQDFCHAPQGRQYDVCEELFDRSGPIARHIVLRLADWKNWRTFDASLSHDELASDPTMKSWDKGNWSNGYLPYAFAAFMDMADQVLTDEEKAFLGSAYKEKGEAYLQADIYNSGYPHWIRRSTNHGGIVIGNGYATELLMNECVESPLAASLLTSFRRIAEGSFKDGLFVESTSYMQVFMFESVSAIFARSGCFGETTSEAMAMLYGEVSLASVAKMARQLTTRKGFMKLPYGDCCGNLAWGPEALLLFARFDPWFDALFEEGRYFDGSLATGVHLFGKPGAYREDPAQVDETCAISDLGVVSSTIRGDNRNIWIALSSTQMHLTHNQDWDLGSVYLSVDGQPIIGERLDGNSRRLREAYRHSSAWTSGMADKYPVCFGSGAGRCRNARNVHGKVLLDDNKSSICAAKARINGGIQDGIRRLWQVDERDGHVVMKIIDVEQSGDVPGEIHANYEIGGKVVTRGAGELLIQSGDVRVPMQLNGYRIKAITEHETKFGEYTSLRLVTTSEDGKRSRGEVTFAVEN